MVRPAPLPGDPAPIAVTRETTSALCTGARSPVKHLPELHASGGYRDLTSVANRLVTANLPKTPFLFLFHDIG
jgi:hypothetical protein